MMTSSTSSGFDARALDRRLDRDGAELARGDSDAKSPWKPPIGVRAAPTMTIGSFSHGVAPSNVRPDSFVSLNSSRPISMRRISVVPAPIS